MGGTGRHTDPTTGFSFQMGLPIPCYTMDEVWTELRMYQLGLPSTYSRNRKPWDV